MTTQGQGTQAGADDKSTPPADDAAKGGETQGGEVPPEVTALSQQLKSEKEARRAAQGKLADMEVKLKEFEGIDPAAIREILEEKKKLEEEARKNNPAKLEEFHKQEKIRLTESYETKLKAAQDEVAKLKAQNKTLTVTDKVMASIGKLFNEDVQDIVKQVVERHCDLDESGRIIVKDENGDEMPSPKNRMLPITIEEFGQWIADRRPSLAKPVGMGGTREASQGERARRGTGRIPASMQELQSMPNAKEIWAKLAPEEKLQLGTTWKFG